MKLKLLLLIAAIFSIALQVSAQLPLPIRTIGGTQFYYHEVQKKETLFSIAKKLGIEKNDIIKYNPNAAEQIKEGQFLFFPVSDFANRSNKTQNTQTSAISAPVPTSFNHIVEKGETLYGIAKNYGVTTEAIIRLNPDANSGIKEGQNLKIPQNPAAQQEPDSITTDAPEITSGDTTLVYVTIRPGDTLFSMAKRYNTSIDKLMELNPGISPQNFKSGEIIRVRPNYFTTITTERETTEFRSYEIKRGDTYFSIARKFNISVNDLKAANPDMKKLKRGKTLYIPIKKIETVVVDPSSSLLNDQLSSNDSPIIQEMYDSVHVFRDDNNINVALLLPFMLNSRTQTKQARLYTEFYKGFLLAVDTIRKSNTSKRINVFAYDTQDSQAHVDSILNAPAMAEMDMIFTPDDDKQIAKIAQYGIEHKIAVINSFSLRNDIYNDYSTLFQVNTPQNYMQAKLFDFFDDTFRGYEVVFINMTSETEKEMVGELKAHLSAKNINYTTIDISTSLQADSLNQVLMQGKRYVIIPTSGSRNILIKSLDAIKNVKIDRYDISLCMLGHPEWATYIAEFGEDFNRIDTYIYSRFFSRQDSQSVHNFDNTFHQWYGEYMIYAAPRFGLLGYDTGRYFLELFMHSKDYNNNFKYEGLQNSFDFDRISNWSGFINKSVYFIHFTVFNTTETYIK